MEFRRSRLLYGFPAVIRHSLEDNRVTAYVDEGQFAPELATPLGEVAVATLALLLPAEEIRPTPALRIRIRRSGALGHELAVAEFAPQEITVAVDKTLITDDLAAYLSDAGTAVARGFIRKPT
ncbi:hypothetical protein ACFHYQ_06330 [Sphaerimonospora cavernae]|uniref:Uncharacterized protein n=1 Tax=Sphaerimonospora cavernae TaxID=1740611 RepID=A0ABV6U0B7_9ACTN